MKKGIVVTKPKEKVFYSPPNLLAKGNSGISNMFKDAFELLEMDKRNIGKKDWNPFKDIITEGNQVLIKPNLVNDKNEGGYGEDCLYTNPTIVKEVIDYCVKALNGTGRIIIADAPVQQCDFNSLIKKSGYLDLINYYKKTGVNIELIDLRGVISYNSNGVLIQEKSKSLGKIIDLGKCSEHSKTKEYKKFRITNYDPNELLKHHNNKHHEYYISDILLNSDVVINVPKPKSHRKAGVTIGMKNFVGVNVRKEYLPHHKFGSIKSGGDEYEKNSILLKYSSYLLDKRNTLISHKKYFWAKLISKISRIISAVDKRFISREKNREGSWHGNDTIWRTVVDINKIVFYADKNGNMQKTIQRKVFNIADMIVVGEKEGPLLPQPKYFGAIVCGMDILKFDQTCCLLLGINEKKIPLYNNVVNLKEYVFFDKDYSNLLLSKNNNYSGKLYYKIAKKDTANIEPSSGWKGYIEL